MNLFKKLCQIKISFCERLPFKQGNNRSRIFFLQIINYVKCRTLRFLGKNNLRYFFVDSAKKRGLECNLGAFLIQKTNNPINKYYDKLNYSIRVEKQVYSSY